MGERTGISWTDHTFNPWQGCAKVPGSPACDHCYAETLSIRVGKANRWGPDGDRDVTSDSRRHHVWPPQAGHREEATS